eukprot:g8504.t1
MTVLILKTIFCGDASLLITLIKKHQDRVGWDRCLESLRNETVDMRKVVLITFKGNFPELYRHKTFSAFSGNTFDIPILACINIKYDRVFCYAAKPRANVCASVRDIIRHFRQQFFSVFTKFLRLRWGVYVSSICMVLDWSAPPKFRGFCLGFRSHITVTFQW